MIGFFRVLSWVLVALALMLLGADGISTLEEDIPVIRSTAEILSLFGLNIDPLTGGGVAKIVNFFLEAALWAIFGVAGIVLTLLFRPLE